MSLDSDLARLAIQEERLVFDSFNADTAWTLGSLIRTLAASRNAAVAIDITVNGHQLFFCAMPGTTPNNADWIRRKRNVTQRFHTSSYAVGLNMQKQQTTLTEKTGAPACDYATHGGAFPINLKGGICIGTITVSGLPQRDDHDLVVRALATYLRVPLDEIMLG